MRLQPDSEHPHGLPDRDFDALFTTSTPVVFAFHGYPTLIHRLTYRRTNHANFHVRGYKEEGTTTTPFDMVMLNDLDRFRLVMDVIDRVPSLGTRAATLRQRMSDARLAARAHTREYGEDAPEIAGWTWPERAVSVRVLTVNAGSSSVKVRLLADDDGWCNAISNCAAGTSTASTWGLAPRLDRGLAGVAPGRTLRSPRGARRRRVHRTGAARRGACAVASRHSPTWRRCTSRSRSPRSTPSRPCCPGYPRRRASTRRSTRAFPRRRRPIPSHGRGARSGTSGATASTACRTRTRRDGRRAHRTTVARNTDRHVPPRRRRLACCCMQRSQRRHHDGVHAARRAGDGHARRLARSRPGPVVEQRG